MHERDLLRDALSEIGHPAVEDRSSPRWPFETFQARYGDIKDYASELISEAVTLEHLISEPQQRQIDLASAYIVVLDQWRRSQNTVKALKK